MTHIATVFQWQDSLFNFRKAIFYKYFMGRYLLNTYFDPILILAVLGSKPR